MALDHLSPIITGAGESEAEPLELAETDNLPSVGIVHNENQGQSVAPVAVEGEIEPVNNSMLPVIVSVQPVTITIEGELAPDLANNPAAVYLAALRPTGRQSMRHHLDVIADMLRPGATALTFPWHELRYQHTAAIRSQLQERYAPITASTAIAALRRTLQEAWKLGQMSAEDYQRAIQVQTIKGERLPRGRALDQGELRELVNVCSKDATAAGARDAAIIAIGYNAGLRRSELATLNLANYNERDGSLKILGAKGGKDRIVFIGQGAAVALADWLVVRGAAPGALFNPINKGGKVAAPKRMTAQSVMVAVQKRRLEAGLQPFTPHDLRRSFISDLLDAGADIVTVQKMAGHADVSTTAKYDRRGDAAKQKAAGLLHFPYGERRRLPLE